MTSAVRISLRIERDDFGLSELIGTLAVWTSVDTKSSVCMTGVITSSAYVNRSSMI